MTHINVYVGREKERHHEWYFANRERILAMRKASYEQNKEEKKKYSNEYYYNNRDKIKPKKAVYRKKYAPRHNELERLRRLRPDVKQKEKIYRQGRTLIMKDYHKDYSQGIISTKKILEIEKSLPLIKELYYEEGWDAKSIGDRLSCTNAIIIAVLRKNNLLVKQKQFSRKRYLPCSNGLLVRSNAERLIVETLLQRGISFVYEQPIPYKDTTYYPDFYIPDRDLFVEYAGLTDKSWYVEKLEKKRLAYQDLQKNVLFITKPEQIIEVLA
jgi:hypothetical protein